MKLPKAIICDIDGTLANHEHRMHFVDYTVIKTSYGALAIRYHGVNEEEFDPSKWHFYHTETKQEWKTDWDAFYEAMDKDIPNEWCRFILEQNINAWSCERIHQSYEILFVTGRPEKYRSLTMEWLSKTLSLSFEYTSRLFMRPNFLKHGNGKPDHRPSHEVKEEIYDKHIKGKCEVLFVLEDNEECAEMYRNKGLTVLECK